MKLFIIISALFLSACSDSVTNVNTNLLPEEFKDCSIVRVYQNMQEIVLARCPNSTASATYKSGKTTKKTITIDGETYIKSTESEIPK